MARHFDLLTAPVRDNARIVASAQVGFAGARDFSLRVAKSVERWFDIEKMGFDGNTFLGDHLETGHL